MARLRRLQEDQKSAKKVPYWRVQNSWGHWWGDQGFINLEITEGVGVCGVNQYVYWVEAADSYDI